MDSDSQVDQGGNPLGEGAIVGADGEVPLDTGNRGRDNYMHGSIIAALAADWHRYPDQNYPGAGNDFQLADMGDQPRAPFLIDGPGEHPMLEAPCPHCQGEGYGCQHCGETGAIESQPVRGYGHEGDEEYSRLGENPNIDPYGPGWVDLNFKAPKRNFGGIFQEPQYSPCPDCGGTLTTFQDGGSMCDRCEKVNPPEWKVKPLPTNLVHHQQGYEPKHAFGKTAGPMEVALGLEDAPQGPQSPWLNWQPGMHGRGLMIDNEPHTWVAYNPAKVADSNDLGLMHREYVTKAGISPEKVDWHSGVEIEPNGTVTTAGGRDPGPFIHADPRLKQGEDPFMNFFTPGQHSASSRTSNTDPYLPWTHEADAVEFDKGPLAGPQHSVMVNPGPAGIHGAHYRYLDLLDAHLDGQPARQMGVGGIMMSYADPNRKQPVEVKVHHPEHIPAIQEQLEMGQSQPVPAMQELGKRIQNGEVPPPPPREQQQMVAKTAGQMAVALAAPFIAKAAGGLMKNVLGIGGGGEQQQQPQQEEQPNLALAAVIMSDYETPASNPDVGVKTDNDPEKVDQKEFNDQDKNPSNMLNPNLEDSGASGEDGVREHAGFGPESPGIERMKMALPLLMHYYHSPESGENDPMVRSLHETLEAENPGYLDRVTPEEEQLAEELVRQHAQKPHGVHAKTAIINVDPNDINQHMQNTVAPGGSPMMPPGGMQQEGHCPACGGVLNATGACPQCGQGAMQAGNPQMGMPTPGAMPQGFASADPVMALMAATHQGPVTPEQISAVQELLVQEGRAEETPMVPIKPEDYIKELAQIQGNPNVAPQVGPQEQTQPPQPQMGPPGAMPVPGMGGGEPGGQPMQPMARSAADSIAQRCPKCNSATTGVLDGENCFCHSCGNIWETKDLAKDKDGHNSHVAADSIARRCPKCASATTGVLGDDEGNLFCHSCGNVWKEDTIVKDEKGHNSRVAGPGESPVNPVAAPAAERHHPRDPDAEEDSSLTWKDLNGQQLVPGQEYEMHNPAYQLPDVIRVERVKPDGIEVSLIGTFPNEPNTLQARTTISAEDMKLQHMSFKPIADSMEDRGNEPPPGSQAPGEPPKPQTTDEAETPHAMAPTASVDHCPKCGHKEYTSSMASETSYFNECYRCGHTWEEKDAGYETDHNLASREWINEDGGSEDFFAGMERARAMADSGNQSRDLSAIAARDSRGQQIKEFLAAQPKLKEKMAGRHFTPSEQRELIDEDGVARNSDLLDLEGTHYTTRHDVTGKANGGNVPDSHLSLGV